jgi:hypothetical protein
MAVSCICSVDAGEPWPLDVKGLVANSKTPLGFLISSGRAFGSERARRQAVSIWDRQADDL